MVLTVNNLKEIVHLRLIKNYVYERKSRLKVSSSY